MEMPRATVLAAIALIVASLFLAAETASASQPLIQRGVITAIVDPITVEVRVADGTSERVQLYGVAAASPASCALARATADVTTLALGKPAWLVAVQGKPSRRDRRSLLAFLILPGGLDLGLELVKQGEATVRDDQPPFKQLAVYVHAQSAAQTSSIGVWSCTSDHSPASTTVPSTAPGEPQSHGNGQGQAGGQGQGQGRSGHGADGFNGSKS
jgi:endonuclease YncB( thermonuclease family)